MIAPNTKAILDRLAEMDCTKGCCLVGGTALAAQIHHRFSLDIDLMQWVDKDFYVSFRQVFLGERIHNTELS